MIIEENLGRLARHTPPEELVLLSDAKDPTLPFCDQQMAEVLETYSILTVPFHWLQSSGSFYSHMYDFLDKPSTDYCPVIEAADGENVSPFGDRLGGWPVPIQHDPEPKFRYDRSRSFLPGNDEIRLLFSWGGEYFAGTRLMHSDLSGDGVMHLRCIGRTCSPVVSTKQRRSINIHSPVASRNNPHDRLPHTHACIPSSRHLVRKRSTR